MSQRAGPQPEMPCSTALSLHAGVAPQPEDPNRGCHRTNSRPPAGATYQRWQVLFCRAHSGGSLAIKTEQGVIYLLAPLETALQCTSMSSMVTGSVVSCPCTTIATLSPTSRMSMPALSTCAGGSQPSDIGHSTVKSPSSELTRAY